MKKIFLKQIVICFFLLLYMKYINEKICIFEKIVYIKILYDCVVKLFKNF